MDRDQIVRGIVMRSVKTSVAVAAITLISVWSASAQTTANPTPKMAGPEIMLMQPTAPKSGDNQFQVMVKGTDGKPINDADVSVVLLMSKTATMAEMRNEVKLKPSGNGMYTGPGNVMMAGTWNATVSVKRSGKEIGQKKVTLTAK